MTSRPGLMLDLRTLRNSSEVQVTTITDKGATSLPYVTTLHFLQPRQVLNSTRR